MPKSLLARYAGASNGRSLQTDEKALLAVCVREAWVRGSTMGRRVRRAITAVKEKTRVTRKTNPSRPEPPEGRPMTGWLVVSFVDARGHSDDRGPRGVLSSVRRDPQLV